MKYRAERLILTHVGTAFGAFALAAVLGAWQMAARSPLGAPGASPETYYASVTAHGSIMAYAMPILFIMGFGYFVAVTALDRPLPNAKLPWVGYWLAVIGVAMAVTPIVLGKASVLYTFYPPLTANAFFYIGLVVAVIGSWIWAALMLWAMAAWKKENPGKPVPLAMFATTANAVLWIWTTGGVAIELLFQVIPGALGLTHTIDVGLARTLFSWTLHPIVYFWLMPAYIAFYTMAPQAAGGRLYSDMMARLSFFLLVIYSVPIGLHHLYMDPEQGFGFKFIQMFLTALVTAPTLLTIFTIGASLEIAGRLRGGQGLFGWIGALPWDRPLVLATGLAFVLLGFGGFGGLINMSYGMNAMVHNTSWVTAHFHLIFGGSVVIMYFAIAYEMWPHLLGREARSWSQIRLQIWLWFVGVSVTTAPWHVLGLQGQPRRVATFDYSNPAMASWATWTMVSVVGGLIMLSSALLFVWNLATLYRKSPARASVMRYAVAVHPPERVPALLNGFTVWNWLLVCLMIVSYGYPIAQFFIFGDHSALIHQASF